MGIKINRLTEFTGAEIEGVDLAGPVDDETIAQIRKALVDYCVVVFRKQHVPIERQLEFSSRFGELEEFPEKNKQAKASSKIFLVSNVQEDGTLYPSDDPRTAYLRIVEYWHTDSSYRKIPALFSFLQALEVPAAEFGGQTEWTNLAAAYNGLPDNMKDRIKDLKAIHTYSQTRVMVMELPPLTEAERQALPPVLHPVVRTHPESGKKSLFITAHSPRIAGLPAGEGEALLYELLAHATQPKYVYRHYWEKGDLLIWDNRHSMHRVLPYDPGRHKREMYRTCVAGSEAVT